MSYLLVIIPPSGEHCGSPKYSSIIVNVHFVKEQFLKNLFILKTMILYQLKTCKTFVELKTNKSANNWLKAQIDVMEW